MCRSDFFIPSQDNINQLHVSCWQGSTAPKAVLQIVHGMVEYIQRYDDFASFLVEHDIAVIGHDHLGHGLTASTPHDLGFFHETDGHTLLIEDMYRVTKEIKVRFPDIPLFILGHSMGSFCTRKYLTFYGKNVDGAILMGVGEFPPILPTFGKHLANMIIRKKGSRYISEFLIKIAFHNYLRGIDHPKTNRDWITRDEEIVQSYVINPLSSFYFTASAYRDLFSVISFTSRKIRFASIPKTLPILITSGEADPVGNWGKSPRKLYKLYKKEGFAHVQLTLYPQCRHEILNEQNRQEVYEDLLHWIREHTYEKNKML